MTEELSVPSGVVKASLNLTADPSADVYQRLLRERIVFLGTQVDQNSANQMSAQLLLLEAEDPGKDISLYINSPGGSVTQGLAIYDTMQYVRCHVATYCLGLAATIGQFLLCRRHSREAVRPAECPDPDSPAERSDAGAGGRHRHPSGADRLLEADDGRTGSRSTPARRSSASRRTPIATAGSRPRRRSTTDSSTK